jgi:hypothetical protein
MSAFAHAAVLAHLRQRGWSNADALRAVRAGGGSSADIKGLDAFLSGRTTDVDIDPLMELAHALGLTLSQFIGDAHELRSPR